MPRTTVEFSSLLVATDVDVLAADVEIADRGAYVVVRSPQNPGFYWGNFLVDRSTTRAGSREALEQDFAREFTDSEVKHLAFAWEFVPDAGFLDQEFTSAGYDVEYSVALVATPDELVPHPSANADVEIRMLDPNAGSDEALWTANTAMMLEDRPPGHTENNYLTFLERRMRDRRERFTRGDGGWFVALVGDEMVASCGVIVTDGRARYQAVGTRESWRRKGVARRLVHDVGVAAIERFDATQLVICGDANYHALPLYESLGFVERDRSAAVTWWPTAPNAARHPTFSTE